MPITWQIVTFWILILAHFMRGRGGVSDHIYWFYIFCLFGEIRTLFWTYHSYVTNTGIKTPILLDSRHSSDSCGTTVIEFSLILRELWPLSWFRDHFDIFLILPKRCKLVKILLFWIYLGCFTVTPIIDAPKNCSRGWAILEPEWGGGDTQVYKAIVGDQRRRFFRFFKLGMQGIWRTVLPSNKKKS